MNYDVFSYFNGDQIQGVLNAVVMLVGSGGADGDYLSLIRIAGVFGLFIAVAAGIVRARGEDAGAYLVMMAIFYSVLFIPRATVTINEVGLGAGGVRTVANVPLGLAFFASTTSHIGYWLTQKTETFFSLPDADLNFGKHGLMGASRALRETSSAAVQDPVLQQDMINFMRDCVNPEIANSPAMVAALMNSTALWQDITVNLGILNPGRMVTLIGYPTAVPCTQGSGGQDAVTIINSLLPQEVTGQLNRIAALLTPAETPANAQAILAAMLPASESLIITASETAADAIKQRMMINLMNNTSASMAQITNDPVASQNALATAMAAQSANSSYQVMASLAAETLPLIRNAIELVIIGIFPIVLVLIVIAGTKGGLVLRSYVMTMLWVQLWAPLYAIVNYVGTLSSAKSMTAALAGINGVAINNAAQFLNTTISGQAVVGMLTISVPIIALAIVKGGETAMSGVVSGLLGPAQQAGTKIGGQAGLGNMSAGLVSWGNYSTNNVGANKVDSAPSYRESGLYTVQGERGTVVKKTATNETVDATATFGGGAAVAYAVGTGLANATTSGRSVSGDGTSSATLTQGTSSVFSREGLAAFARTQGTSINERFGTNIDFSTLVGAGESAQASSKASVGKIRSDQQVLQGTLGGGANLGLGGVLPLGETASQAPVGGGGPTAAGAATGLPVGDIASVAPGTPAGANVPPARVQPAGQGSKGVAAKASSSGSLSAKGGLGVEVGARAIKSQTTQENTQHGQDATNTDNREASAKRVETAIDSFIGSTSNASEKNAALVFKNAFQGRVAAERSSGYQSHEGVTAGAERRETSDAAVRATVSSGLAFYRGLVSYYGGDHERATAAFLDPAKHREAMTAVGQTLAGSEASRAQIQAGGLQTPETVGAVRAEAAMGVANADEAGQDAVAKQDKADAGKVRTHQFANPRSEVDTAPAQVRASALQESISGKLKSSEEKQNFTNGMARVTDYLNQRMNDGGLGSFFKMIQDDRGVPHPEETQVVVGLLAARSDSIRDAITKAGETGSIPDSIKPYIDSEAKKAWEGQVKPGDLSSWSRALGRR